jgi:hypothetical protein
MVGLGAVVADHLSFLLLLRGAGLCRLRGVAFVWDGAFMGVMVARLAPAALDPHLAQYMGFGQSV